MSEVARILLPVYDLDEAHPALAQAVWLAKAFHSSILIAGVIKRVQFMQLLPICGPGAGPLAPAVSERRLQEFRVELTRMASELVSVANEVGVHAEASVFEEPSEQELLTLTRVCDLLVESRLHRHGFVSHLFGKKDVYTDSGCPLLVSKGEPFKLSPIILLYRDGKPANEALRWVVRLAGSRKEKVKVYSLVIGRDEEERKRLDSELTEYAQAHGLGVEVAFAEAKEGSRRLVELSEQLVPGFVAMPVRAFDRPFRLRLKGIDERALAKIQASVLLFP